MSPTREDTDRRSLAIPMLESRKTVFISCGQFTQEERELGKQISKLIDQCSPFRGYFAENQTTLEALSGNVLRRLYESVGLVVVMHNRGVVEMPNGRKVVRASVWIEQEIALATLMQQILRRPLHVAFFAEQGIAIEGIRQQLQLNPVEFTQSDEVVTHLRCILPTWDAPLYVGDEEIRKLVESVDLSIGVRSGYNFDFTIQVENHSKIDVEIKGITLWSDETRLCGPVPPPDGGRWLIPAGRSIPIQFCTGEDVPSKLRRIHGAPTGSPYPSFSNVKIKVVLLCEVKGLERSFGETSTVQVDHRNLKITG